MTNLEDIPKYIISYNNGFLVRNTYMSLRKIAPTNPIFVVDNNSRCPETIAILNLLEKLGAKVLRFKNNIIHRLYNDPYFASVRNKHFILTDPDLDLRFLPTNTLEILYDISIRYGSRKVGLALDVTPTSDMYSSTYYPGYTIMTWESQFWRHKISNNNYIMYDADIDTTFCLNNCHGRGSIRVAGTTSNPKSLIVKHLPWYKSFADNLTPNQLESSFGPHNVLSSISKTIYAYRTNKDKNKKIKN